MGGKIKLGMRKNRALHTTHADLVTALATIEACALRLKGMTEDLRGHVVMAKRWRSVVEDAAIIQRTEIAASSKEIDSRLCCKFDLLLMVSSRESSVEPRIPAFVHAKQTSPLSIVFQRGLSNHGRMMLARLRWQNHQSESGCRG
jgi:hypothetical protein